MKRTYLKKDRYRKDPPVLPTHNEKTNWLIENQKFKEEDRDFLNNLSRSKLNTVFATHFYVEGDASALPRDPRGQFAIEGGTKHQVRKMQKMGIKMREVESV